jgi:hypothetical protein
MFLERRFIMDNAKMIEMLNRINEKIDKLDSKKIEADFSDPTEAMRGFIKRIIDSELAHLEGRLPAPDDLLVQELDKMF